jgi:hypothetical protein
VDPVKYGKDLSTPRKLREFNEDILSSLIVGIKIGLNEGEHLEESILSYLIIYPVIQHATIQDAIEYLKAEFEDKKKQRGPKSPH